MPHGRYPKQYDGNKHNEQDLFRRFQRTEFFKLAAGKFDRVWRFLDLGRKQFVDHQRDKGERYDSRNYRRDEPNRINEIDTGLFACEAGDDDVRGLSGEKGRTKYYLALIEHRHEKRSQAALSAVLRTRIVCLGNATCERENDAAGTRSSRGNE